MEISNTREELPGFWVRVLAGGLDLLLVLGVSELLEILVFKVGYGSYRALTGATPLLDATAEFSATILFVFEEVTSTLLAFGYYVWGVSRYRTTFGKSLMGIYVVPQENPETSLSLGRAFLRCVGYLFSTIMGAGFLMIAFHPRKQGLHDLFARSQCVYRKNYWSRFLPTK